MFKSPFLLSTAFAAALAVPARAEPVTLPELFSLDRLATTGAQWAISALRSVAEVRFVNMDVQVLDGRLVLTGLDITPYTEMPGGVCTIHLDRAVAKTAPLDQVVQGSLDLDLMGVEIAPACFQDADPQALAMFGIDTFKLDHGHLRLDYDFPTGGVDVTFRAASSDLAEIEANATFDYVGVNADTEEPIADLSGFTLAFTNRGVMENLAMLFPPEAADPEMLGEMLRGMLLSEATPAPAPGIAEGGDSQMFDEGAKQGGSLGGTAPAGDAPAAPDQPSAADAVNTAEMNAAIDGYAKVLAAYLANPDRLVLRLHPAGPVRITQDMFNDFESFASVFHPTLEAGNMPGTPRLTAADQAALNAWLVDGGPAVADDAALAAARAFLTGIGAPRDVGRALQILTPLLAAGNGDARDLVFGALDQLDPADAYRIARDASAAGDRTAFARLDQVERKLGLAGAIAIQAEAPVAADVSGDESPTALRAMAFDALTGFGAPRDYARAYLVGLLALAGGDSAAASIIDEVEGLTARLDTDTADAWQAELSALHDKANEIWFAAQ